MRNLWYRYIVFGYGGSNLATQSNAYVIVFLALYVNTFLMHASNAIPIVVLNITFQ